METLLIADDERSIREGLKYILDWESLGFTICDEAKNGEEALQKMVALNPSLVLLDVRMPKMLGTEVLGRARKAGFTGKCIILSGYSDFSYAQEAIENGVSYYITKPLDEDELYNFVCKIKDELGREKDHTSNLVELKSKAKEVILKEHLYGQNTSDLGDKDKELLQLDYDGYQVVISTGFQKDTTSPYSLVELLRVSRQENNCFEQFVDNGLEIVILKGSHGMHRLSDILEHFDEDLQEGSPLSSLFITYGRPVDSFEEIHISYGEARALLERHFFCPMEQHYMGFEDLPSEKIAREQLPDSEHLVEYGDKLTGYIQAYNHQQVADTLQAMTDYLVQTTKDTGAIKMFLTDIYFRVNENMVRVYPSASIPFPPASQVIRFVDQAEYLYEIIRYLSEQFSMIMDSTGNPSRDTILDDILYYIDHNYTSNIKLDTIAPLFGYNSAYLGKIFHKTVGESFNSYIDHKRIEASVRLLEQEDSKVYQIAELVGYKNVDYFHKKFRKYMGVSPAEYRKNLPPL